MGKPGGFKEYARETAPKRPAEARVRDWDEIHLEVPESRLRTQGARCMDCGVPFCHAGCPLGNLIPDWNDMVWRGRWRDALELLLKTNSFPEFTGRVCPAPCEEACVLAIDDRPVSIEHIELSVVERGFAAGWIRPEPPAVRSGKKVAIVGSGPAGLAAAAQLNRAGHLVTVFERDDRIGGLLVYGIPQFKLEKHVVERRVALLEAEGVVFRPGVNVGVDVTADALRLGHAAVLLCGGATVPRDLDVPGRGLGGIHFAMDYLVLQNRRNLGMAGDDEGPLHARGKRVVVIGGGDTGADCLGTALRQGALSVTQLEILPRPPETRTAAMPWPWWPAILRTSAAHEEGGTREWAVRTTEFTGRSGLVKTIRATRVDWEPDAPSSNSGTLLGRRDPAAEGRPRPVDRAGGAFDLPCDLCLLAMGFSGPEPALPAALGAALDPRGNVAAAAYATSVPGVFAAGDMRRGQSLVVWAIAEGRGAARAIDAFLMGSSDLP